MAMTAHGTILEYSTTETGTYTAIAELTNISFGGISATIIDVSTHDSTWRQKIAAGLKDAGQITIEGKFIPTSAAALQTLLQEARWWKVRTPNAIGFTCQGILSTNSPTFAMAADQVYSATIDLTGPITYDVTAA